MQHGSPDPADERPPGEGAAGTFTEVRAVTGRRRRGPILVAVVTIGFLASAVMIKALDPGPSLPVPTRRPPAAVGVASIRPTDRADRGADVGSPRSRPDGDAAPDLRECAGPRGLDHAHARGSDERPPDDLPARWLADWRAPASMSSRMPVRAGRPVGRCLRDRSCQHVPVSLGEWRVHAIPRIPRTAAGLALALSAFWGQDPNLTPFFSNSAHRADRHQASTDDHRRAFPHGRCRS